VSFTDVLMVEITNVSVKLSVVNTCFVPCYVVDCFGVDRDRERQRECYYVATQSATETEATWLEFKAITWLNARFPVRPGHSPTQLPMDGQTALY
jgi:hypothetical protein